ncbi:MAG: alanine dehydrogenase, partial [Planctomycetota bacterium]
MIIGVPKETKTDEYRVALLPVGAQLLCRDGHTVLIEQEAGLGSGFDDEQYSEVGAQIVKTADEIYARAEMIVKVKEPQPPEIAIFGQRQTVFCYFHFAASRE